MKNKRKASKKEPLPIVKTPIAEPSTIVEVPAVATFNILGLAWEAFGGAKKRLKDNLHHFDPQDLICYLNASGWEPRLAPKAPGGTIFTYGEKPNFVVFIPTDKGYIDYDVRMLEALKTLVGIVPILGHEKLEDEDFTR